MALTWRLTVTALLVRGHYSFKAIDGKHNKSLIIFRGDRGGYHRTISVILGNFRLRVHTI